MKDSLVNDSRYKFAVKNPIKHCNEDVMKCINLLEKRLSTKGFAIIEKFMDGAANGGHNRYWKIKELAKAYDSSAYFYEPFLLKSHLRSYSNTVLFGLIETGDLVKFGKYLVPKDYVEMQKHLD